MPARTKLSESESRTAGPLLDRRDLAMALALLAAGAIPRLWAAFALDALPAHFAPDEPLYRELAAAIEAGRSDERSAFVSPLYPSLVALVGGAASLAKLQLALGSGLPPLTFLAVRRAGANIAGAAFAGGLVALHAPFVAFDSALLPASLSLVALGAALAIAPTALPTEQPAVAVSAGAALALAVFLAPALLPVPLLWAALWFWRAPKRAGVVSASLLAPLLAAMVVATAHSAHVGRGASPFGLNAGITLAHGNLEGARGTYRSLPGSDASKRNQHTHAKERAQRERGADASLDWAAVDRHWRDRAIGARLADPLGTAALLVRKLAVFALARDVGDELGLTTLREAWPHLRFLPLPFALLGLLGATGIALGFRSAGVLAISGGTLVTCLVFYVSDRYRLPAALGLALPAGIALTHLQRLPSALRAAACLGLLLALLSGLRAAPDAADRERGVVRAAEAAEYRGDRARAIQRYRELHAATPGLASRRGLGRALLADGRNEEALAFLGEARVQHERDARLANDHGVALLRAGRLADARRAFEVAAAGDAPVIEAEANLAVVLERSGDLEGALLGYRGYAERRPEAASGWLGIARVARRLEGKGDEAKRAVENAFAVAVHPAEASQARAIEAMLSLDRGDRTEWRRQIDRLRDDPTTGVPAWKYLLREMERLGRREDAVAFLVEARRASERRPRPQP